MNVIIRSESVELDGYVNAVERRSKPLKSRLGTFREMIRAGTFRKALEKNDDVRLKLNHERDLGGMKDGTLELSEDSIGLKAHAVVKDADVIDKARAGKLVGWSFGFLDVPDGVQEREEDGMRLRDVSDLYLREVSILDNTRHPAYEGTLVKVRDDSDEQLELYGEETSGVETRDETPEEKHIDYSAYEALIEEMRGKNDEGTDRKEE